ncbi:MAG TPA: hypothetical protein VFD64_00620 [Gemmatimonadaceae bacterium]|nr:hypothetical protein [Gemmatimonadaceae bacterium]
MERSQLHAQSAAGRESAGIRVIEVAAAGFDVLPTWRLEGPNYTAHGVHAN